jgi:hypothetical protein
LTAKSTHCGGFVAKSTHCGGLTIKSTHSGGFTAKSTHCGGFVAKSTHCGGFNAKSTQCEGRHPGHFIVCVPERDPPTTKRKGKSLRVRRTRRTHHHYFYSLPTGVFPRNHSTMLTRGWGCVQVGTGTVVGTSFSCCLDFTGGRGVLVSICLAEVQSRRRPATRTAKQCQARRRRRRRTGGEARLGSDRISSSLWGCFPTTTTSPCLNRVLFLRSLEGGARAGRAVCDGAPPYCIGRSCRSAAVRPVGRRLVRKGRNNKKQVQAKLGAVRSLLLLVVQQR